MNIQNQIKLNELLKKFNSGFEIHEFHKEWNTFLNTLSKSDQTIATQAMMSSMLDNAKSFSKDAIQFAENGTEKEREAVIEMVNDLKEHPFFHSQSANS